MKTIVLKFVLLISFASANLASAQVPTLTFPFQGVIKGDNVNVRSGASTTYYATTKLEKGDIITVHENLFGWYKISPPEGSFSYISEDYVKLAEDGKTGTVTGNRVIVRVPAKAGPEAEHSYRPQMYLNKGDSVEILGKVKTYYKISPPKGARLFVKGTFVGKATPEDLAAAKAKAAKLTKPETTDTTKPNTTDTAKPETTDSTKPETTDTTKPETTDSTKPNTTDTTKPKMKDDPKPVTTDDTTKPNTTDTTDIKPITPKPTIATTKEIVLTVEKDESIKLDGKTIASDKVKAALEAHAKDKPNIRLLIQAGKDTPFEQVTKIVSLAKSSGVTNMAFNVPKDITDADPNIKDQWEKIQPSEQLAILEKRFKAISKRPVAEQPLDDLETKYKSLDESGKLDKPQQAVVDLRLQLIASRREVQTSLEEIAEAQKGVEAQRKKMEEEKKRRPKQYVALGQLQSSTIYNGRKLPLMYRVVDPQNNVTIAYLRPSEELQIKAMLGQYVGIVGAKSYDATLKLNIIEPELVDVLKPR